MSFGKQEINRLNKINASLASNENELECIRDDDSHANICNSNVQTKNISVSTPLPDNKRKLNFCEPAIAKIQKVIKSSLHSAFDHENHASICEDRVQNSADNNELFSNKALN